MKVRRVVGKDKPGARDLLLDAVSPDGPRKAGAARSTWTRSRIRGGIGQSAIRTGINLLSLPVASLLGRDPQLAFLDQVWANPAVNIVQIIAAGGTGKTALVDKWFRRHLNEATVFGWSFYSQGTSENRQTSSDPFLPRS